LSEAGTWTCLPQASLLAAGKLIICSVPINRHLHFVAICNWQKYTVKNCSCFQLACGRQAQLVPTWREVTLKLNLRYTEQSWTKLGI